LLCCGLSTDSMNSQCYLLKKPTQCQLMMPTILNNRYKIIQTLGSGGFGETFLAEDTHMPSGRQCVIKQLKPITNNPQVYQLVQERFRREAAILEELGDGNNQIPSLHAYFESAGQFYLVQEWIKGGTLANKLQQQGTLSESIVREILIGILPVLDFVHNKRIVHRDIKPDNIILHHSDGKPVLIDFGAVKETMGTVVNFEGNTNSSIVIGTPGFMPSEQAAGRPVYSSDLYSLGLTAIYLLTGKMPQQLDTDSRTGEIIWRQYAPRISPSFAAVLDKAIMSHPRDRYATAREMLDALQSAAVVAPTVPFYRPQAASPPATATSPQTSPLTPSSSKQNSGKTIILGSVIAGSLIGASVVVGLILTRTPQPFPEQHTAQPSSSTKPSVAPSTPVVSPQPSVVPAPVASLQLSMATRQSPEQFVQDQYSIINNHQYQAAWSRLSTRFQNNQNYSSYVNWWNTVEQVDVQSVQRVNSNDESATVYIKLKYYLKNGKVSSESRRILLLWNAETSSWIIDESTR